MDYALGDQADALRERLRTMIHEHIPENYLSPFSHDPEDVAISRRFIQLLADEGLLALAWPVEYGGLGADVAEQTVLREEMWAHYEPRANHYMGLNWAGPALMRFGTEQQRDFFLPRIAAGSLGWCQGFSEPDAGTDLASLRTFALREREGWRINGQKIWTSYAPMADYCMCAVRTDREAGKHEGLSLFMLPMDREGIEVRPIASMLGHQHLNEVFLTDVLATDEDILGAVNDGWSVMRYALAFERVGIARYARTDRLVVRVRQMMEDGFADLPASLRARFIRGIVHNRVARLLSYRVIDAQAKEAVDDAQTGAARFAVTRVEQEVADVLMEMIGSSALDGQGVDDSPLGGAVEDFWRYTRASTVASGSIDVQRMHLARSALGSDRGSRAS